ncbi:MAG: hypothetical protein C6Y22_29740 [Hapalosiphonaceae cyanobacterium JJU2]|nr:MAG: hypothetical protein C6Y22_29740 [Hapalosiphonaceae cyanobacterium JJU2]
MIESNLTLTIENINETHDKEGSLICHGVASFSYRGKDGMVVDEIPYRAKGSPAVDIKGNGENCQGIANGYIDLQINEQENYKEKVATLVIRGFIPTGKTLQELAHFGATQEKSPDFAQELSENISSDNNEKLGDEPPF